MRVTGAIALMLFGIALAVAIGEIAARGMWRQIGAARQPPAPAAHDGPVIEGVLGLVRPNAEGLYRGVYYRANSAGFRGREFAPEPSADVFRIAVAGDSFTMGDGVLAEHAYPSLVETALNGRGCGRFEVLNFGLAGLNIHQVVRRARALAAQFSPHLLVYGLTVNDIEGPAYHASVSPLVVTDQRLRYRAFDASPSYLMRMVWPRLLSVRELLRPRSGTYQYELLENYFSNPDAWRDFAGGLDEFTRLREERETPVVVFLHTVLVYLNRFHPLRPIYSKVSAAAEERGMKVVPSLEQHYGHRPEDLWVSEEDTHPNGRGHGLLAAALVAGLDRHGYLPSCASSR
jgi:lysophospholipase L1-like esterase